MKKILFALCALLCSFLTFSQQVDPNFKVRITQDAQDIKGFILSDGKYLLYGQFAVADTIEQAGIVRMNADGTLDETFEIGAGITGKILAVTEQSDGKVILAGPLSQYDGQAIPDVIRLNTDGSLDNSFGVEIDLYSSTSGVSLACLPDDRIVLAALIGSVNGQSTSKNVIRLNADGTVDTTFAGADVNQQIFDIAIKDNGDVLLAGNFTAVNGLSKKYVARLQNDGDVDTLFNQGLNPDSWVFQVEAIGDSVIIAGYFHQINTSAVRALAHLNNDGSLNSSSVLSQTDITGGFIESLARTAGNHLIIGGTFTEYRNVPVHHLIRVDENGDIDNTFAIGTGANDDVNSIHVDDEGNVLATGRFTSFNGIAAKGTLLLNAAGSIISNPSIMFGDPTWVRMMARQGSKILVAYDGNVVNGEALPYMCRLNADGTIDHTFQPVTADNFITSIFVDRDGNILVGGPFTVFNGITSKHLVKLDENGNVITSFSSNIGAGFNSSAVDVIVEQYDGKILVGGGFTTFDGQPTKALVRLNSDGTLDATFNTADGFATDPSASVFALKPLKNGKILVGGEFDGFSGEAIRSLVKLNADGTLDETLDIGSGIWRGGSAVSAVYAIDTLADGKVLIGGSFDTFRDGQRIGYMVALDSAGTLVTSYDNNYYFLVDRIARQSDNKIIVVDRGIGVTRLDVFGNEDPAFVPISSNGGGLSGLAIVNDEIFIGGHYASVEGKESPGVIKIVLPTLPIAPGTLQIQPDGHSAINLTWTDNSDNESGFYVERSGDGLNDFETLAFVDPNTTTYRDVSLNEKTVYYYRIGAANAKGVNYSAIINDTTGTAPPNGIPHSLQVASNGKALTLDWINGSTNEEEIHIYRSVNSSSAFNVIANLNAGDTTFVDSTVVDNNTYYYKVQAYTTAGVSAFSNTVSKLYRFREKPAAPDSVDALSLFDSLVYVRWNDNSVDEDGFRIYRSVNDTTDFSLVAQVGVDLNYYYDDSVQKDSVYFYRLSTYNDAGESQYSNIDSALAYTPVPDSPSNLIITRAQSNLLDLAWQDNTLNEVGFIIERSVADSVNFQILDSLSANWSEYSDTAVVENTVYYYRVAAYNASGFSYSNIVGDTSTLMIPDRPEGLHVTTNGTHIQINWEDNAYNESGFEVYRSANDSTNFVLNASVGANTTLAVDSSVIDSTTYYYKVRAVNAVGASTFSNTIVQYFVQLEAPPVPQNVQVITGSNGNLTVVWSPVTTAQAYQIFRSVNDSTSFSLVATLQADSITYNDVTEGNVHYYKVIAANVAGVSDYSEIAFSDPYYSITQPLLNACSGRFVDSGGLLGFYQNSEEYLTTIEPTEAGHYITLRFDAFDLESGFDYLTFYDGPNDSASVIGTFSGSEIPDQIRATNPEGKLTVRFTSDGSIQKQGWEAELSCVSFISNQPSNLQVEHNEGQVVLTWSDNSIGESTYFIRRSVDSVNYVIIDSLAANSTTFTDEALVTGTTYYYKISAANGVDESPALSYSFTSGDYLITQPVVNACSGRFFDSGGVLGFYQNSEEYLTTIEPTEAGHYITLSFNAFDLESWYDYLTFYDGSNDSARVIGTFSGSEIPDQIRATNPEGKLTVKFTSDGSQPRQGWESMLSCESHLLNAPSDLQVEHNEQQAVFTWNDNSIGESTYLIRRSVDSVNYVIIDSLAANSTTFTDEALVTGITYYYKISAANGVDESPALSYFFTSGDYLITQPVVNACSGRFFDSGGAFESYQNNEEYITTIVPTEPGKYVRLSFDAFDLESRYDYLTIYDGSNDTARVIGTFSGQELPEFIMASNPERTLTVKFTSDGLQPRHGWEAILSCESYLLNAPSDLQVEHNEGQVVLTWNDNSIGESTYFIRRSVDSVNYVIIDSLAANATTFTDDQLVEGTTYYYKISAARASEESDPLIYFFRSGDYLITQSIVNACSGRFLDSGGPFSSYENNEEYVTTIVPTVSGKFIKLSFEAFETESGFDKLIIYDGSNDNAQVIGTFSGVNLPEYVMASNPAGTLTVKFTSDGSYQRPGWEAKLSCATFPNRPTELAAQVVRNSFVDLSWNDQSSDELGFVIERSINYQPFDSIGSVPANTEFFTDDAAIAETTLKYRVRAIGQSDNSHASNEVGIKYDNGVWLLKAKSDSVARWYSAGFSLSGKGYIAGGRLSGYTQSDVMSYDNNEKRITTVASLPVERAEAVSFTIDQQGYLVTGLDDFYDYDLSVWAYNPAANQWVERASFIGTGRTGAVGFSINGFGYVGLGYDNTEHKKDMFRYDPVNNSWTEVAEYPGNARSLAFAFVINGKAYVGTGSDQSNYHSDVWAYDPVQDTWTRVADFPGVGRNRAVGLSLNGKGYVFAGYDASHPNASVWEYSPATDTWSEKVSIPYEYLYGPAAFVIEEHAYIAGGDAYPGNGGEVWQFTPTLDLPETVAPVTALNAEALSKTSIKVTWSSLSVPHDGYRVFRSTWFDDTFVEVGQVSERVEEFVDVNLQPNTWYNYKVQTLSDAQGHSELAGPVDALTWDEVPAAPDSLIATATGPSEVELSWNDNSDNEWYFVIERSQGNANNFKIVGESWSSVYTDETVNGSTVYFYRVYAANRTGNSLADTTSVSTPASLIAAPSNFTAIAAEYSVHLSWVDHADNESKYVLTRYDDFGFVDEAYELDANTEEFTDNSVFPFTTYVYQIAAVVDSAVRSDYVTNEVVTLKPLPDAPFALTISLLDSLNLGWTHISYWEEGFIVEQSFDQQNFHVLDTLPSDSLSYNVAYPAESSWYRVAAFNSRGKSAYSDVRALLVTSAENNHAEVVDVFPVPANDHFKVAVNSPYLGKISLRLYDLQGRVLLTEDAQKTTGTFEKTIHTSGFRNTTVLMRLQLGLDTYHKIIVVR